MSSKASWSSEKLISYLESGWPVTKQGALSSALTVQCPRQRNQKVYGLRVDKSHGTFPELNELYKAGSVQADKTAYGGVEREYSHEGI